MTDNPLDVAICKALNDRRIFWMPQVLIDKNHWAKFKEATEKGDKDTALQIVGEAKVKIQALISKESDSGKKNHLKDAQKLLAGLETNTCSNSSFVQNLVNQLDCFGPIKPNLPNMEDFGKVLEGYSRPTAEQFFLYKIQKEKYPRKKKALSAIFEVVKDLYEARIEPLKIAFFIRKIDSLTQIVEVLNVR